MLQSQPPASPHGFVVTPDNGAIRVGTETKVLKPGAYTQEALQQELIRLWLGQQATLLWESRTK